MVMTENFADASVRIRPAAADDLPAIVAMRDRLNELERAGCAHAAIQPFTLEQFTTHWSPSMTNPNFCWRIVEAAGRPVGFGLIYLLAPQLPRSAAYIHWAYLEENQRRRGAGRLLLDELLAWARSKGASRVELQFIDGNQAAERFWTKMGFRGFARKCVRYLE
jgi:GNAT superfamily N-acetyltransferase